MRRVAPVPSVDSTPGLRALPVLLSLVAGTADVISFLGLDGLFVAHITGNVIVVAARVVTDVNVGIAVLLALPVFVVVLAATRLLVAGFDALGVPSLRWLLILQFLLLLGYLGLALVAEPHVHPNAAIPVTAGMLGVCAMAVQNALVQVSVRGAPTTAVMTTNITRFTMDVGEVLFGTDPDAGVQARRRAANTWPAILGFALGAVAGAGLYAAIHLTALVLPAALALLALLVVEVAR